MKVLLTPYNRPMKWCAEFFPGKSICSLPVAGKALAEHLVDLASNLNASEVLLLDYSFDHQLKEQLGDGSRWSLKLRHIGSGLRRRIVQLVGEHSSFFADEPVIIIFGALLPEITDVEMLWKHARKAEAAEHDRSGVYLYKDGELFICEVPVQRMSSLKHYFELNFKLLENPGNYVLPGYSAENGVHTGMNVAIMTATDILPPVMLGDDIVIERGCSLSDGVILGKNVVIDRGTRVAHSVILDHSFIGRDMEIDNKIVATGRIVDPFTGVFIDFNDSGIASDMRKYGANVNWCDIFEAFLCVFLVVVFTIPYLLFYYPWRRFLKNTLWSYKLSADRYPRCWQVLLNGGKLVKCHPDDRNFVFRASDAFSIRRDFFQQRIDDDYFRHHRSAYKIFRIVVKGLINRLFVNHVKN